MEVVRTRVPILDIEVTPMNARAVTTMIAPPGAQKRLIVGHNLHSVYLRHTDELFAKCYEIADVVLLDGQPIRLLGLLAHRRDGTQWVAENRVGSVDWLRLADPKWPVERIAVVGAADESNRATVAMLTARTGVTVRGWPGQAWNTSYERLVVKELREFSPNLVLIGLGMPLQEHFFLRSRDALPSATYALVGGAIDQLSGFQQRAPNWVGRIGAEWLWRLARNPRRFAHRYLVEPLLLVGVLVRRAQWRRP